MILPWSKLNHRYILSMNFISPSWFPFFSFSGFAGFSLSTIISLSSLVRVSDGRTWPVNIRMYQFLGVWRAFVRDWFKRGWCVCLCLDWQDFIWSFLSPQDRGCTLNLVTRQVINLCGEYLLGLPYALCIT